MQRVSVALATHNGAKFIVEQLESILAQSSPVFEVVLSDDASSDETVAIVRELFIGRASPQLLVLENKTPLGVQANFEQAIGYCRGELIALCDQDDIWHPDRIAVSVDAFTDPLTELFAADARLIDAQGKTLAQTLFSALQLTDSNLAQLNSLDAFELLLKRNLLTGATMMFRRNLFERTAPFPGAWLHDEWLAIVAALTGGLRVVTTELIDYRQHGGNVVGVTRLGFRGRVAKLFASGEIRNARLLARAEQAAQLLPALAISETRFAVAANLAKKLAHEVARSSLPTVRWRRIVPILREWRSGRYHRFGGGARDVLRDLLQPR